MDAEHRDSLAAGHHGLWLKLPLLHSFPHALLTTAGFFFFTIYGLIRGIGDTLGIPTALAAFLALVALVVNVYLILVVG